MVKATLDDIERLITFKVADRLPLVLAVGQAESEILAEWRHRALTYAVLCVQLGAALIAPRNRKYKAMRAAGHDPDTLD